MLFKMDCRITLVLLITSRVIANLMYERSKSLQLAGVLVKALQIN